jgi:hypothetical protein
MNPSGHDSALVRGHDLADHVPGNVRRSYRDLSHLEPGNSARPPGRPGRSYPEGALTLPSPRRATALLTLIETVRVREHSSAETLRKSIDALALGKINPHQLMSTVNGIG